MPFTPSHAVVALPFVRTPLVPAAIAVGAMTPDLPLFVRGLPLHYGRSHAFEWIPVTVLVALVLLLVWRCVLRPAAGELAPAWLARRLPEAWNGGAAAALRETLAISRAGAGDGSRWRTSWRGMLILLLSLVIGVVSHIVWDLFTHEGRWGVSALPVLEERWGPLAGYKWLQHGSTALGLAAIGLFFLLWLLGRRPAASITRSVPSAVRWAWWLSLPLLLVVAWSWGLTVMGPLDAEFTVAHLAYRVLPSACAVWGVLTLGLCVSVQVVLRGRRVAPSSTEH
ncbi:DUF4184 family protein [Microbacterium sp. HD4P20]|uniref:DUF4184 family protein n=1 Tax=Microbacterium sp. HD4P20 TaxID=2864874 RepID=UPI001C63CC10|nr:DUF4184 family protein [Microbacterium sp. HD4P20]MCP2637224.1 DUF4184 family protein [Microbacterium sp. HD4P20]